MADERNAELLEWIERRLARLESDAERLDNWKRQWLAHLASNGYSPLTCKN